MIEAEFAFFQVMKKLIGTEAVELLHTTFGKGPEALDAVNMVRANGKLIIAMIDPEVLSKPDIDQAIVTTPFVGMDDDVRTDIAAYNGLQRAFLAVVRNASVYKPIRFA